MEVVAGKPLRVQSLAQAGLANVPSQFIQPPETRPWSWGETPDSRIPVIDLFLFDPQHSDDVRRNLRQYCSEWGAFQVRNHGVPQRLLDDMRRTGLSFFNDCPMSERSKYFCDPNSAASEGYGTRMLVKDDSVLDWRDYFDHHSLPLSRRNPTRWPDFPPNYREVVTEYSDQMNSLAQKLLGLMSESLGLSSSCIEKAVGEVYQNITISYYPPCPQPELTLGLQAHSDIGALTLLIQDDVGGLQIITNGKYRSAEHRAITNANRARLSVATFHEPAKTRKISPAAELLNNNSSLPRYREVVYGEYVSSWYTKGPEGKRNVDALLLVH